MKFKPLVFGGFVAFSLLFGLAAAYASSSNVLAQVTVISACIISLDTGSISFGSMAPGATSTDAEVNVNNTGNTQASVNVNGSAWSDGTHTMAVGQTRYSASPGTAYGSMTALTGTPAAATAPIAGGATTTTYWKLSIPAAQAAGAYNQTITFSVSC